MALKQAIINATTGVMTYVNMTPSEETAFEASRISLPIYAQPIFLETPQVLVTGTVPVEVYRYTLPTNSCYVVTMQLIAINAANGDRAWLEYKIMVTRLGGNALRDAIVQVINARVGGATGWIIDGNVSGTDFVVTVQNPVAGQTLSCRFSLQGVGSRPGGF